MLYQAHLFLYELDRTSASLQPFTDSALTTRGQGKLSIFISCSKLESLIRHYQIIASPFKLSFQEQFPTLEPFRLLASAASRVIEA